MHTLSNPKGARWTALWLCGALGIPGAAHAGTFDARGMFHVDPSVLFYETFEDADQLAARGMKFFDSKYVALPSTANIINSHIEVDAATLEGGGYFKIVSQGFQDTGPAYVSLSLPPMDGRIEMTLWTRADHNTVVMSAVYQSPAATGDYSFTSVVAVPTGRRTSDDWVEVSTGPIDSHVLGVPLTAVRMTGQYANLEFDALEVRRISDRLIPDDVACTVSQVEEACGAQGDCIMGRCVDAAMVWGAVPYTATMRHEYLERLGYVFMHTHGNRSAVAQRGKALVDALHAFRETASPRLFFGGVTQAVEMFRDGHTNGPSSYASYYSSVPSTLGSQNSGALGVCFGLTQLDAMGGGRGYSVFRSDAGSGVLGGTLRVGDVLTHVDGEPVDSWLMRLNTFGRGVSSDPTSEPAYVALDLPDVLSMRAKEITVATCESSTHCLAPTRHTYSMADRVREEVLSAGTLRGAFTPFKCDGRFTHSVAVRATPPQDGSDPVNVAVVNGVTTLEFNGFSGDQPWKDSVSGALSQGPAHVLFDTRLGNGGYGTLVEYMVDLLRDTTSPRVGLGVGRPWDNVNPQGYDIQFLGCIEEAQDPNAALLDLCATAMTVMTSSQAAPAAASKVAWLNTADISGNDYAPRMLQGRPNTRIFGPHATAGAFGAIVQLAPLLPGEYMGGSIQIHDTRFADTKDSLPAALYNSGTGVLPDEVSLQKLSDSLMGKDTMLTRALAWLAEAP